MDVSVLITKVFVFLCCINVVVLFWVLVPDKRLEAVWPCFIAAFFLSLDVCSTYFVTWLSCVIWLTWSRTASKLLSEMFCDFRGFWALGDTFTSMLAGCCRGLYRFTQLFSNYRWLQRCVREWWVSVPLLFRVFVPWRHLFCYCSAGSKECFFFPAVRSWLWLLK